MRSSVTRAFAAALLLSGVTLAACSPTTRIHGYMPPEADVARIRPGVDTAATVEEILGLPAGGGVMRDSAWYYVESTFENYTYHAPRVLDRKVLAVNYSGEGVVTGLARYGVQDGRIIDLANETTETGGQQLGVLQQLFGNILNMDPGAFQQQGPGTQTGGGF